MRSTCPSILRFSALPSYATHAPTISLVLRRVKAPRSKMVQTDGVSPSFPNCASTSRLRHSRASQHSLKVRRVLARLVDRERNVRHQCRLTRLETRFILLNPTKLFAPSSRLPLLSRWLPRRPSRLPVVQEVRRRCRVPRRLRSLLHRHGLLAHRVVQRLRDPIRHRLEWQLMVAILLRTRHILRPRL